MHTLDAFPLRGGVPMQPTSFPPSGEHVHAAEWVEAVLLALVISQARSRTNAVGVAPANVLSRAPGLAVRNIHQDRQSARLVRRVGAVRLPRVVDNLRSLQDLNLSEGVLVVHN